MSDYFFSEKMRRKIIEKTEDGKGIKLGFGEINAYRNLDNYVNWLMSVISYSRETGIEIEKLVDLIDGGVVKGLEWKNEPIFISIFKDALNRPENTTIKDNALSKNSEMMDK